MKRTEALRPLSREHLKALIAAKRVRDAATLGEATKVFLDFWEGEGRRHFRVEEEVLLPGWAVAAEVDQPLVDRFLAEHLEIRCGALRLAAAELSLTEAHELGKLLHDHVRFEERVFFPKIEDALDDDYLARLAAAIEAAEESVTQG